MVKIHAQTILPATPHRTALSALGGPHPTMAPVMVWVVEPAHPEPWPEQGQRTAGFGTKAPTGLSLVILLPMVLTMRQPPNMVPRPMAV